MSAVSGRKRHLEELQKKEKALCKPLLDLAKSGLGAVLAGLKRRKQIRASANKVKLLTQPILRLCLKTIWMMTVAAAATAATAMGGRA